MARRGLAGMAFPVFLTSTLLQKGALGRSVTEGEVTFDKASRPADFEKSEPRDPFDKASRLADFEPRDPFDKASRLADFQRSAPPHPRGHPADLDILGRRTSHQRKEEVELTPNFAGGFGSMLWLYWQQLVSAFGFQICLVLTYHGQVISKRPSGRLGRNIEPGREGDDFDTPKFSCLGDWHYCITGMCFYGCRLADNVAILYNNEDKVRSYWGVLAFYLLAGWIGTAFFSGEIAGLVFWALQTLVMVRLRSKLRRSIGRKPGVGCSDFLFWCFCPCCALLQEAKEADKSTSTRMKVDGYCCPTLLVAPAPEDMVGSAVGAPTEEELDHPPDDVSEELGSEGNLEHVD